MTKTTRNWLIALGIIIALILVAYLAGVRVQFIQGNLPPQNLQAAAVGVFVTHQNTNPNPNAGSQGVRFWGLQISWGGSSSTNSGSSSGVWAPSEAQMNADTGNCVGTSCDTSNYKPQ